MEKNKLRELLSSVADGSISADDAFTELKKAPFTELGFANVDTHRSVRNGVGEVIYGEGKTAQQIAAITDTLIKSGSERVMITRISQEKADAVGEKINITYDSVSRIAYCGTLPVPDGIGKITVITGGTSDIPVAEEAVMTAKFLGNDVVKIYDAGVAGIHRLFAHLDEIMLSSVIIAIAGMEGALASVVGGLAQCPVIAVPTSVGYGANFGGLSALLSMLNSCASGVSVVNIDNGFGAAYQASLINHIGR